MLQRTDDWIVPFGGRLDDQRPDFIGSLERTIAELRAFGFIHLVHCADRL